uniref:IGFBP N-terminal domain-containing protein n=1 Tax=Heterorhabditis bacteriophora TaxID=37862 RepID=A0A1I7XI95_HETBA
MSRWLRLAVALYGLTLVNGVGSNEANLASYELSRCSKTCPQCREPDCEETVIDQCGCCPVCVRHVGESCGAEAGVCATHLTCTQLNDNDELGQCTEMYPERCLKAMCSVVFHPECPPDSRLVILPPPQGQCCGRPGTCHCDQQVSFKIISVTLVLQNQLFINNESIKIYRPTINFSGYEKLFRSLLFQKCEAFVPICEAGTERTLIEEGGHEPGKCCDRFECKKRELHCLSVHCPPHVLEEDGGVDECPADSIRPAIHIPQRTCCPIKPG